MRIPAYISPSSLKCFEGNKQEYYMRYQAGTAEEPLKPPKLPQTTPMAVGSAFDAYIKSYLQKCLKGTIPDGYEFETLFEKQVEPHNRDRARIDGKFVFDNYVKFGAAADLMLELNTAVNEPRFEFEVQGFLSTRLGDVPLLGKPDIFFVSDQGVRMILDWKVNGFYSNSNTSPAKGYIMARDCWFPSKDKKASSNNRMPHKDCYPQSYKGIKIGNLPMEEVDKDWCDQLLIYAWLMGEEPGSNDLILGIDQIVGAFPYNRAVSHRTRSMQAYQLRLQERLADAWAQIRECSYATEEQQGHWDDMVRQYSSGDAFAQFIGQVSRAN